MSRATDVYTSPRSATRSSSSTVVTSAAALPPSTGATSCYADSALSFIVGGPRHADDAAMIATTERALQAGIDAAGPGVRIGDISFAMGSVLHDAGYLINTDFGGHGIGSSMHQDPHVSNIGRPGRGYTLRPGLMLALEPWIMADTDELITDADGWTLRSATGCAPHTANTPS